MTLEPLPAALTVPNPARGTPYTVRLVYPEFACRCPFTEGMDAASVSLTYQPDAAILELAALCSWLEAFTPYALTHEAAAVEIATALTAAVGVPVTVVMQFDATEGIGATVTVGT